jgi:predicted small metal-binding protein
MRKYIDCREFPSESHCSIAISADTEEELLTIAVQHAIASHGYTDSPELRTELRKLFRDGMPPEHVMPASAPVGEHGTSTTRH